MPTNKKRLELPEDQSNALLTLLRFYTGLSWEWYWGHKQALGIEGTWQLMPRPETEFWEWHLDHKRQWFDDKTEAALSLLDSYRVWRTNQQP